MATPSTQVPPGPKGNPLWGQLPHMRRDSLGLMTECFRTYGDVVRIHLVEHMLLLNHPDHVKHVLLDNHANYVKTYFYDRMRPLVGNGLLTNDGESWLQQRRLAQPAFHRPRLLTMMTMFSEVTDAMVDGWQESIRAGTPIDIHHAMMTLAMALVSRALFNLDVTSEAATVGKALQTCMDIGIERFHSLVLVPLSIPTPDHVRFNRAVAALNKVVNGFINARRQHAAEHSDLLSMLIEAQDEQTGKGMSDLQLRDEVMTLFMAGHETVASSLCFFLSLLVRAPEVEARLFEEIRHVTDLEAVAKLPYLGMCFNEALRLYPPGWLFSRKALQEDEVGGYRIRAGSSVLLCPYTLHRHPQFWDEPDRFIPERFAAGSDAHRPKMAFIPFGGGPRLCIGWHFAMMEAHVAIATILRRVQLRLVPGQTLKVEPSITLRPAGPIMMTAHPR